MFKTITATLATAALVGSTQLALAWGPNGHRITAQVAQDNMSADALSNMQAITGARSLALIATWPDFVRSFPVYDCFKPWHFLTVEDGQAMEDALKTEPYVSGGCDPEMFKALDLPRNVVEAIDFFHAILGGDSDAANTLIGMLDKSGADPLDGSIELTALALLVHLVGDIHQPLHVGRGPDRGGNTITVDWFGTYINFHEVWDEALIEKEALSFTEFAAFLDQDFADKPAPDMGDGAVTWAQESVDHREAVYTFKTNPNFNVTRLSYQYAADQNALLKQRLRDGGMRLAALLDELFAN